MKLTFNDTKEDFNKFFNMLTVYKNYADLLDHVSDEVDIEPPLSAIDLLITRIAFIIITNKWYQSTLSEEESYGIIQYLIGMGKTKADQETLKAFNKEGNMLSIDLVKVWEEILKNGIEI